MPTAMPLFWQPYKSDISQEQEQRAGRALLWDKPIDPEWQAEFQAAKVPQQAYVYQTKPQQ